MQLELKSNQHTYFKKLKQEFCNFSPLKFSKLITLKHFILISLVCINKKIQQIS